MSRGRRRDEKTANHKKVTLMRREKRTNTSIVYVLTQKKRHKINILRTLKLADCIDMMQSYMITYTEIKNIWKGPASKVHCVLRNNNFLTYKQLCIKHIELCSFTRNLLRYIVNHFCLWVFILSVIMLFDLFKISGIQKRMHFCNKYMFYSCNWVAIFVSGVMMVDYWL